MKIILQPEVAENQTLKAIVEAATPVLADAIGERAAGVTATWDVHLNDQAQPILTLSLDDDRGEAAGDFAIQELQSRDKTGRRFRRLWDDLLKVAFRRKMQTLEAALAEDKDS